MPGIRVQHPTQRSCRYTVVEPTVPYRQPYACTPPALGGCGATHLFKTHHLNLDGDGAVIVSEGVLARIRDRLILDGFAIANEVTTPPAIVVGTGSDLRAAAWAGIPIVRSPHSVEPT